METTESTQTPETANKAVTLAALANMAAALMRETCDAVTILQLGHRAAIADDMPGDFPRDAMTGAALRPAERAEKLACALYEALDELAGRREGD